jgi:transposase
MTSLALSAGPIHLGLDMSKNKIAVGILQWEEQVPDTEVIFHDEASIRRLVDRFVDRGQLRVCYEAGPTGFGLYRLLRSMGVACDVAAPSLIPKAPGDRVKTDRRDCRRLARLHRAGELVAIRVPTEAEEAVRDLCRARADLVDDRTRTRHRLSNFLLRHNRIWRDTAWTAPARAVADRAALRRRGAARHARPVPGGAGRPRRRTRRGRGRSDPLLHARAVRRGGGPARRLPRYRVSGRVDHRQRSR